MNIEIPEIIWFEIKKYSDKETKIREKRKQSTGNDIEQEREIVELCIKQRNIAMKIAHMLHLATIERGKDNATAVNHESRL